MPKSVAGLSKLLLFFVIIGCKSYKTNTVHIQGDQLAYSYEILKSKNSTSNKFLIYVPYPDTLSILDNIDAFKYYINQDYHIIKLNKFDGGFPWQVKEYDKQDLRFKAYSNILTHISSDTTAELHLLAVGPEVTGILPVASGMNFKSMVLIDPWIKSPSFNFNYIYHQEDKEALIEWINSPISTANFLENIGTGDYNDYTFGPYRGSLWSDIWNMENTSYLYQIKCNIQVILCMNRPYRAKYERLFWDEWNEHKKRTGTVTYYTCPHEENYTDLNLLQEYLQP